MMLGRCGLDVVKRRVVGLKSLVLRLDNLKKWWEAEVKSGIQRTLVQLLGSSKVNERHKSSHCTGC